MDKQLYRLCYLREGKPLGITFSSQNDLVQLHDFTREFEEREKVSVLTIKPLGKSAFLKGGVLSENAFIEVERQFNQCWLTGVVWKTRRKHAYE